MPYRESESDSEKFHKFPKNLNLAVVIFEILFFFGERVGYLVVFPCGLYLPSELDGLDLEVYRIWYLPLDPKNQWKNEWFSTSNIWVIIPKNEGNIGSHGRWWFQIFV